MRAGLLRKQIEILKRSITKDEFGASNEIWETFLTVRAAVTYKNGNKSISDFEIFASQVVDFQIRFTKLITESMRVKYNGQEFKILFLSPNDLDNSLTISTELIND